MGSPVENDDLVVQSTISAEKKIASENRQKVRNRMLSPRKFVLPTLETIYPLNRLHINVADCVAQKQKTKGRKLYVKNAKFRSA